MFANLKNKIFEEVKASPSKLQQFAQAAQAAVSSSSSNASESVANDGNFFSITEEDTPQNSPLKTNKDAQAVSVVPTTPSPLSLPNQVTTINNSVNRLQRTRKLSNSSIASDVSFRLPSYESSAMYHLQSDLEVSGSEHEDSASTTHLDIISKEQLHDAYRRSLDRYQKYRSRYTDLAKKYRELERDCTKARSVLVETQDKAIRRINELREQCSLEQQAKAHLEEALRMEMDDMQCKIKSYETKLKLQNKNDNINEEETLIKLDDQSNLISLNSDNSPNENATFSSDNDLLKSKSEQILELERCLKTTKEELELLKKREEENSIQLAEKKLEIYSELESKEKEINDLKQYRKKFNDLESKFKHLEKENNLLKKQSNELVETKEKIKQITAQKQEFEAKVISHDHIVNELKKMCKQKEEMIDQMKKDSEEKIQALNVEYESKLNVLQAQANEQNIIIERSKNNEINIAQADNELNTTKTENDILKDNIQKLEAEVNKLKSEKNECENQITQLQNKVEIAQQMQTESCENERKQKQTEMDNLISKIEALTKNNIAKERETLKQISSLEDAVKNSEEQIKKLLLEKSEFESRVEKENQTANILSEIEIMQTEMNDVRESHSQLENEKQLLEEKIEKMHKENLETQEGSQRWQSMLEQAEQKLQIVEQNLLQVESENCELAEKNCLLEENSKRLEKLINESDDAIRNHHEIENELVNIKQECKTHKDNIKKLENKLAAVLIENSELHNSIKNLQENVNIKSDLLEAKLKEYNDVIDVNHKLENEKLRLQQETKKLCEIINEFKNNKINENNVEVEIKKTFKESEEKLLVENQRLNLENNSLLEDLNLLKSTLLHDSDENLENALKKFKDNNLKRENQLSKLNQDYELLKEQHVEDLRKYELSIKDNKEYFDKEINILQQKLLIISKENTVLKDENESFRKEIDTLNNQNQSRLTELEKLLTETKEHNQTLQQSVQNATDLEKKLQNYEQLKIENEYLNTLTNQLESDLRKQKEEKSKLDEEILQLKSKIQSQQCELYALNASNEKLNSQISDLSDELKYETENNMKNSENFKLITCLNEATQKDLLVYQQKLNEAEKVCTETRECYEKFYNENNKLKSEIESLKSINKELEDETGKSKNLNNDLTNQLQEAKNIIEQFNKVQLENEKLKEHIKELEIEISEKMSILKVDQKNLLTEMSQKDKSEIESLRTANQELQSEITIFKQQSSLDISNLNREIDDLLKNSKQLQEQLSDFENLKEQAIRLSIELDNLKANDLANQMHNSDIQHNVQEVVLIKQERDDLQQKLNKIMHEVQDVSNRNLFLEQQCENYLILEQSNERLKLANEKLSRQLDETLVSIHHNDGIQANTEFEYLKNIMFQYLTGTMSGNNETLVKVIAAVLKFSPQQTQVAIEKEHQRHSLMGQINNLL